MADASNSPAAPTTEAPPAPTPTTRDNNTPDNTTPPTEETPETSNPPEETSESERPPPDTTTSEDRPTPTTSDDPPETTEEENPPDTTSSRRPEETTSEPNVETTTRTPDDPNDTTSTVVTVITRTPTTTSSNGSTPTVSDPSQTSGSTENKDDDGGGGLSNSATIAVAVVVPVVAVALFLIAGIWFWKRRKAAKNAEEERRKEIEDYAYNPNTDPTLPPVGGVAAADGPYEMRDDQTSGYRGWGSTAVGSAATKPPTTMSGGGHTGGAYSDATGGTYGNFSDTRSGDIMVDGHGDGAYSPEGEILGALGPSAAANRDIRRGPSNASSSYSAGARSDGSDGAGAAYVNQYYDQYAGANPYAGDAYNQRPSELPGQPIIRDNPARRNTRIESPSQYPQQSAGISQNF